VLIDVTDNGCGVSNDALPRIFDPFFTTKPVGQGTGLGLSISHSIVANHGGRIVAQSAPNIGTTLRVHLPIKRRDKDSPETVLAGPE
jgi:signal transduction histidine kinase